MLAVVLSAGLLISACGGDDDDKEGSGAATDTEATAEQANDGQGGESLLFVQNAESGTLRPTGHEGSYTLTLTGVDPHAIFFADRPARDSGVIRTDTLIPMLYGPDSTPPNAALVVNDDASQGVASLELVRGKYDAGSGTVTYEARTLNDLTRPNLQHLEHRIDQDPPKKFGRASLFIDTFSGHQCHGSLINQTENHAYLFVTESFSKKPEDTWVTQPQQTYFVDSLNSLIWHTSGGAIRGCYNEVTVGVYQCPGGGPQKSCEGTGGPNGYQRIGTLDMKEAYPWGGDCNPNCGTGVSYSCTVAIPNNPGVRCQAATVNKDSLDVGWVMDAPEQ